MRDLIPSLCCFVIALFFGWLSFEMFATYNDYHRLASLVTGIMLGVVAVILALAGISLSLPEPD